MNIPEEVQALWDKEYLLCEERVCGWVSDIETNRKFIREARQSFREWEPLRVYLNVTNAKKTGTVAFSLRYMGQEVARLKVNRKLEVNLHVEEKHRKSNEKYFKKPGKGFKVEWDSPKAKEFRTFFKDIESGKRKIKTHSQEHQIETNIIKEMRKTEKGNKFDGKFSGIQPITYEKCPFQFPTPITGSSGKPNVSKTGGNMDIVARRCPPGNGVRISIWELKKPDVSGTVICKAIKQAIIYASTLKMILRSECGKDWYKLMGFSRSIPKKLKIEAVVCISTKDTEKFDKYITEYRDVLPFTMGSDLIIPCVAYYDDQYNVEEFKEIKF